MATSLGGPGRTETRPSLGELVNTLTEKLSQLVRDEIRLAKAEVAVKAKHAGIGIGLFAGAAFLGFFGFALLITTAVLGLAHAVPDWLAALIVAVVLLAGTAGLAVAGRRSLSQASPPGPVKAQESIKADVAAVKEGLSS